MKSTIISTLLFVILAASANLAKHTEVLYKPFTI